MISAAQRPEDTRSPRLRASRSRGGGPVVSILSWDGPTPPRLQRLVDQSVARLAAECGPPSRFNVWLERRGDSHHVRLDVELAVPGALAGWQLRAESTGPSVERSLRSALRAVSTFARG